MPIKQSSLNCGAKVRIFLHADKYFYALCTQTAIFFDAYQGRFDYYAYLCRRYI